MRFRRYRSADRSAQARGPAPPRGGGYGAPRAMMTLLAAGVAGLLIWLATQIGDNTTGGYWAVYGLIAGAGLVMALSQLLGGWTKWGMPRLSLQVFLLAFVPTLLVGGWIVAAHQPDPNWLRDHVLNWSSDIHVRGLVNDVKEYVGVFAFGIGLVFGYIFDTTGPRRAVTPVPEREAVERGRDVDRDRYVERDREPAADGRAADEPTTAEREAVADRRTTVDEREEEPVATSRRGGFLRRG